MGFSGCLDSSPDPEWEFENKPFGTISLEGKMFDGEMALGVTNVSGDAGFFALPPWVDVDVIEENRRDISSYSMNDYVSNWFVETGEYSLDEWEDYLDEEGSEIFSGGSGSVVHLVESFSLPFTISFYQIAGDYTLRKYGGATCVSFE